MNTPVITLDGAHLRAEDVVAVARGGATVALADAARQALDLSLIHI